MLGAIRARANQVPLLIITARDGLSGLATGASWVCYFRALKLGDAARVAPVDKFSLVLVAIFALAFLGERPSIREWCGILMISGGVLLFAIKR